MHFQQFSCNQEEFKVVFSNQGFQFYTYGKGLKRKGHIWTINKGPGTSPPPKGFSTTWRNDERPLYNGPEKQHDLVQWEWPTTIMLSALNISSSKAPPVLLSAEFSRSSLASEDSLWRPVKWTNGSLVLPSSELKQKHFLKPTQQVAALSLKKSLSTGAKSLETALTVPDKKGGRARRLYGGKTCLSGPSGLREALYCCAQYSASERGTGSLTGWAVSNRSLSATGAQHLENLRLWLLNVLGSGTCAIKRWLWHLFQMLFLKQGIRELFKGFIW